MSLKVYDQIIIGSGSGGKLAQALAERGFKVALIEESDAGGTCLNRGCIPSKMLIYPAEIAQLIEKAYLQNIKVAKFSCNFKTLVKRVSQFVDEKSHNAFRFYKNYPNIDLYSCKARFVSSHIIQVGKKQIEGKEIFLATGGRPQVPDISGLLKTPYLTSTEALRLVKQPKHIVILGGGDIAAELGFYFAALGSRVTILVRKEKMLTREDKDIQDEFIDRFSQICSVLCKVEVTRICYEKGEFSIHYQEKGSKKEKLIHSDEFLVATGIQPNTDDLGLENTSIRRDGKGFIQVNKYLQTQEKHIWAFGDCTGFPFLRHVANAEVEYLIDVLFDRKSRKGMDYSLVPYAIFTSPQIAGVGKTEEELKQKGIPFVIGKCFYQDVARGEVLRSEGFVKLLFEKNTRALLGAHIIGEESATMCHILIPFLKYRAKAEHIRDMIYIHPALPEAIGKAAAKAFS